MSITLDLSEELVEKLKDLSKTTGETVEEIVRRGVEIQLDRGSAGLLNSERKGLAELLQFAGCIDSGASNSGDNSAIDKDLVRAYAGHIEAA